MLGLIDSYDVWCFSKFIKNLPQVLELRKSLKCVQGDRVEGLNVYSSYCLGSKCNLVPYNQCSDTNL